jgi:ABC-type glutathione transport system ATPase component
MHSVKEAEDNSDETPLLTCRGLRLGYRTAGGWRAVVHGVDLDVAEGSTVALVGESGSGKSTIAKALVKLIPVREGSIRYRDEEVGALDTHTFAPYRKRIQMIFQDPWRALNPRLTVEDLLVEPLRIHFPELNRAERLSRIHDLLDSVHLERASLDRTPAEFSGGQRQRILVARALAVEPELLICDEPVSALDVSIQAKLLELLAELKAARGLTLLFISHDLAVVQQIADRILVLQKGRGVEYQAAADLFKNPRHDYTKLLIEACPKW